MMQPKIFGFSEFAMGIALGLILGLFIGIGQSKLGNVSKNQDADPTDKIVAELTEAYQQMLSERKANAEKQSDPQAVLELEPTIKKEIIVFTLPNCPPCKTWLENSKRFWDAGWTVGECDSTQHSYKQAPTFQICVGDRCYTCVGSLSLEYAEQLARR
jgi:hypothetical protein